MRHVKFKFALNSSTLFPFNLNILEQIRIATEAGYDGIELWMKDIVTFLESGGSLRELRDCITDHGISLVNTITFFNWSDEDEQRMKEGLKEAKEEMRILKEIGSRAVAAPPCENMENLSLAEIADHFVTLTTLSEQIGLDVYLEFWGHAKKLATLSEAMFIALESGLPNVKFLLDTFHMYKGGSSFDNLAYLKRENIGIFHVNDYPKYPTRNQITDRERLFPGDGVITTEKVVSYLENINYQGYLSLELFMESFENQTPTAVAAYGLKKMKQAYLGKSVGG